MDIRYWVRLLDRFDMTRAPVVRTGALVPLGLIMQS